MTEGIPYAEAWRCYQAGPSRVLHEDAPERDELLRRYHPDHRDDARAILQVGANRGEPCHGQLASLLQSDALIDEADLAGVPVVAADVLIVGGGGAGCAAALAAARQGARVILATKLRLGDGDTVLAGGGIQAAIGAEDSPQSHYDDTLRAGHHHADRRLVAQMVLDGPEAIRWLIELGMLFDLEQINPFSNLALERLDGAAVPRLLSRGDRTGLEMMRVLREAVAHEARIQVYPAHPAIELLSDPAGACTGAVLCDLARRRLLLAHARAVILTTGGIGRVHLNDFPTSNHFGATGDGLVLAYRLGAKLRDLDSFQYHPAGLAHPRHLRGGLVAEAARSHGARLLNGLGERFVDEAQPCDVVSAAMIRECAEGRGIVRDGQIGVWLDTPGLERERPGTLQRLGALRHLAERCGHDPAAVPFLVYPTLHYQNGGVVIDGDGATTVAGLFCAGEVAGGIHGRDPLPGNALLDRISFGRRAGAQAAVQRHGHPHRGITIEHLRAWRRALILGGLPLDRKAPQLFPPYANFALRDHLRSPARD